MRTLVVLLVSLVVAVCSTEPPGQDAGGTDNAQGPETPTAGTGDLEERLEDPEVVRIYRGVLDSIAPDDGWERTRYVEFDWIVDREEGEPLRRSHRWDRERGLHRVRAPVEGGTMTAIIDVERPTRDERIWLDGELLQEEARTDSLADRAHGMFINDSYWLLMPFKWTDPGVRARYVGEMEEWGRTYEVVELTFEDVGRTPQNKYRAFVDPASGMFELWQYFPDREESEPSFTNRWTDWRDYGPILLSSRREDRDGYSRIYFENLGADTIVPEGKIVGPGG